MPLLDRALNIMAATPAWLRMPMPITEILATSAELWTSNSPMSFLAAFNASSVRGNSIACTVKVMSVCLPSGVTLCTIMSTLMFASDERTEDARGDAWLVLDLDEASLSPRP